MTAPHILIAGGAGFIGSHLTDHFMAQGCTVTVVDNLLTGNIANLRQHRADPRFTFMLHDICRPLAITRRVDAVLNFASPASPVDYQQYPLATLEVGSAGTRHLLELALQHDATFLQASTSEVYGDPEVHPQPETYWGKVNPVGPRSMYDEAKRYGEALSVAFGRQFGLRVKVARIFNTYGPRMRLNDGRAVPQFMVQALSGLPLTVHGDGMQTRSLVHIGDMVAAFDALLHSDQSGPINLGSTFELTMLDLAREVQSACGVTVGIEHVGRPADDPQTRRPDTTLARQRLGWEATTPLAVGLTGTAAWFAEQLGYAFPTRPNHGTTTP